MEEIIKFLGGATIILGTIAWLIKQLTKLFLDKEIETHRLLLQKEHEKGSINYREKINLYKEISNPIIDLIMAIEHTHNLQKSLADFEKKRLQITTQLAMFAPKCVFDSFNNLIDYLYNSIEGKEHYSFKEFRVIAMNFLSDVRKDIGIYTDEIQYGGSR